MNIYYIILLISLVVGLISIGFYVSYKSVKKTYSEYDKLEDEVKVIDNYIDLVNFRKKFNYFRSQHSWNDSLKKRSDIILDIINNKNKNL